MAVFSHLTKSALWLTYVLMAGVLLAHQAHGGSYQITPLRVELSQQHKVAALRVKNSGDETLAIQAELMAWSQPGDEDHLEPSRELLVTPPIFTVPPGETQVIRVGLRRAPDDSRELSFRLFLQELPPPLTEGFQGLRMVTRTSLPVFVTPLSGTPRHDLSWNIRFTENRLILDAHNRGNGHAQVTELRITNPGKDALEHKGNSYVLLGAHGHWTLDAAGYSPVQGDAVDLEARVNGRIIHVQLPME